MRWVRWTTRFAIYIRDGWVCVWCGEKFPRSSLSLDHVIARHEGGRNTTSNLLTCCRLCNTERGALTVGEWIKRLDGEEKDIAAIVARLCRAMNGWIDRKAARAHCRKVFKRLV